MIRKKRSQQNFRRYWPNFSLPLTLANDLPEFYKEFPENFSKVLNIYSNLPLNLREAFFKK